MDDAAKLATITQYFRELYCVAGVWNLADMRAQRLAAFSAATDEVVIVGSSSELGAMSGQVKFDKMLVVAAINALMREADPTNVPAPPPSGASLDYSGRCITP